MPRCFDKVGSCALGKLLDPMDGWKMLVFAEERQHVQTREQIRFFGDKIWPAGKFVRRTWASSQNFTRVAV